MLIAIQIDVVVVVIDRVDENTVFVHFVGMPIAPCFKESSAPTEDGVAVGTDPAPGRARLQDIRADTDRWEVYLRRKIDLFSKTSVYHTLFIWEEKTDAECIVLNT